MFIKIQRGNLYPKSIKATGEQLKQREFTETLTCF